MVNAQGFMYRVNPHKRAEPAVKLGPVFLLKIVDSIIFSAFAGWKKKGTFFRQAPSYVCDGAVPFRDG